MDREILMAGFGGQGIMLMGRMLAYAGMKRDFYVSWMPSYGPEQRGGTANCGVVISSHPVGSPVVTEPTECVVMNEPSLDKFANAVKGNGYLFVNSCMADPEKVKRNDIEVIGLPVTDEADLMGDIRVANMIMLGAIAECASVLPVDLLREVLPEVLPKRRHDLIPLNEKALARGVALVRERGR